MSQSTPQGNPGAQPCPYCKRPCFPRGQVSHTCLGCNRLLMPVFEPPTLFAGWLPAKVAGYTLVELAGQGGMGHVYRARQEHAPSSREVAVKFSALAAPLGEETRIRFGKEIAALRQLSHPNVVHYLQNGEEAGHLYIIMEWIEGESLASIIRQVREKGQVLPFEFVLPCLKQLCAALDALHTVGIIHRDVKPGNVMVMADHVVKLVDLGIARVQGQSETEAHTRLTGLALGTTDYMAPEGLFGSEGMDQRVDIYALGVVAYEMLTGHRPQGWVQGPSTSNSTVPFWFDEVVLPMMAHKKEERPSTADAVLDIISAKSPPPADGNSTSPVGGLYRFSIVGGFIAFLFSLLVSLLVGWVFTRGPHEEIVNSFGMKLVLIPPGKFKMGSPAGEKDRSDDELQHEVEITKAFYLGMHEVTQKQFRSVMGYNPSYFRHDAKGKAGVKYEGSEPGGGKDKVKGEVTDNFPVENVSHEEAEAFCRELTKADKKLRRGYVYRLPTEAQWEYACRGGVRSYQVFHFGNSLSSTQANFDGNYPYGGYDKGPFLDRTCTVGSYMANGYGLCDMHGNVWEWCEDWYDKDYYGKSPPRDPSGPSEGRDRVYRGGSWMYDGGYCRSAARYFGDPGFRRYYVGFRAALVPSAK